MKRGIILLVFVMVLVPSVLGVEISLSKEEYFSGETLQAEITGNFISFGLGNIVLYKEGVPREMPVINGLTKRGDVYYFYAVLPSQEGNFSLVIEDAEYFGMGGLSDESIVKEFVIGGVKGNRSILRINPGFILTEEDFSIDVKSLSGNADVNAELKGTDEIRTLSLVSYVDKTVKFSIKGMGLDSELVIGDYKIPVFIITKRDGFIQGEEGLDFIPSELEGSVVAGQNYVFEIVVRNDGDVNLTGIEFSIESGKVNPDVIDLNVGERDYLNITISVPSDAEEEFSDEVVGKFGEEEVKIPVSFKIIENIDDVNLSGSSLTGGLDCSSQGGNVCLGAESCTGEISPSLEGGCCIGNCVEVKETNYGFYIGIVLLVLIIGIVVFMVWRARKKGGMKMPKDIMRERVGRGEDKMKGSEEVSGAVGRE